MDVVQGKSTNKKVVIAQEIAFAKVLAGNNKTLRDRAVKKLSKWLRIRGNGKWDFTEEEFIRIWTGLFYCMWMSDKFLVQEELAESISNLIHCFKKNSDTALLFIECFNKRILMEWEGLDQYRIDKFNMLSRRFLRQTFVYCKEKNWDEELLNKLMQIFFGVVLHRDNSLGFVLHFISIYAEELAKVSKGKMQKKDVLIMVEPFVKLVGRTKEERIRKDAVEFFNYLMRQTDVGLEFEEQFNAWRQQGFPGSGPKSMKKVNGNGIMENGNVSDDEGSDEEEEGDEPMDPRAGSVHVFLPQIPVDVDGFVNLFKKHEKSKHSNLRGKRALRNLSERFATLKKGKFPARIKKDPILDEKPKKHQTVKNAKELLKFTESLDEGPIRTKEFEDIEKELEEDEDEEEDVAEPMEEDEVIDDDEDFVESEDEEEYEEIQKEMEKRQKNKKQNKKKKNKAEEVSKPPKKRKSINGIKSTKDEELAHKENQEEEKVKAPKAKKKKLKKKNENGGLPTSQEEVVITPKKRKESLSATPEKGKSVEKNSSPGSATPSRRTPAKRKILSNWQVQELDTNSPEYYKIETPKIIRIERKIGQTLDSEENQEPDIKDNEWATEEKPKEEIFPVFWDKAKAKAGKKSGKGKVLVNPFAQVNGDSTKSPGMRRISFALERNMAQENEEYLEEVKNSPTVPFDGSKKPVQSALKSGLSPSPVNPFYRFKRIKF